MDTNNLKTNVPTPSPTLIQDTQWYKDPFGMIIICLIFGIPTCLACFRICCGYQK